MHECTQQTRLRTPPTIEIELRKKYCVARRLSLILAKRYFATNDRISLEEVNVKRTEPYDSATHF